MQVTISDLAALVPGLSSQSSTPGNTRITLRGINTGGVASTVGVYVNEMPFGSSSGLANGSILPATSTPSTWQRIEVLRGPQGTLYGASSLGGVIKYVRRRALDRTDSRDGVQGHGGCRGRRHGYARDRRAQHAAGRTFAVRASGFYRSDDGFIDSIGNNPEFLADPTTPSSTARA